MRVKVFAALAVVAGIAAALVAGVVLAGGDNAPPSPPYASPGDVVLPAVSGPRVPGLAGIDPITGKRVRLDQFDDEPVVLNVWASWCEPCNAEAPLFTAFLERNPDAVLIGVDLQDSADAAKAFYMRHEWSHPSISDPDGALSAKLGLLGLPTTIFLTRDHRESSRVIGPVTADSLAQGYERARVA